MLRIKLAIDFDYDNLIDVDIPIMWNENLCRMYYKLNKIQRDYIKNLGYRYFEKYSVNIITKDTKDIIIKTYSKNTDLKELDYVDKMYGWCPYTFEKVYVVKGDWVYTNDCVTYINKDVEKVVLTRYNTPILTEQHCNIRFENCSKLKEVLCNEPVLFENLLSLEKMFYNCRELTNISGLKKLITNFVTNTSFMFYNCEKLTNIDVLEKFVMKNNTTMSSMFYNTNIDNINALTSWNTGKVKNMFSLFGKCKNLTDIYGLRIWDTSEVTDMAGMFSECTKIEDIYPLQNWNVNKVLNFSSMFRKCENLSDITPIQYWKTNDNKILNAMFYGCINLYDISPLYHINIKCSKSLDSIIKGTKVPELI